MLNMRNRNEKAARVVGSVRFSKTSSFAISEALAGVMAPKKAE